MCESDERERLVKDALAYVKELFSGNAGGHDTAHTLRVWRCARRIAATEPSCDMLVVELAALLHDVDDHKLFQTRDNAHARRFLEQHGVCAETIERICQAISEVSFSQNRGRRPSSIEAAVVQDADRLDALGAIGIARTFAFGGEHARPLASSVQHFYDKLLLLAGEMNTQRGRELAEGRHVFLLEFLRQLERELDELGDPEMLEGMDELAGPCEPGGHDEQRAS